MSVAITVDLTQFRAALNEYMQYTRRDRAEVVNKQCGWLAKYAAEQSPKANPMSIRALQNVVWWARFVNKVLRLQGFRWTRRRKATSAEASAAYFDKVNRQWKTGRKTVGQLVTVQGELGKEVTPAQWLKVSEKLIRRRISKVKSFLAVFGYVAQTFGVNMRGLGRKMTPGATTFKKANPDNPLAMFSIPWQSNKTPWPPSGGRRRPTADQDVRAKQLIGLGALKRGEVLAINSMREYMAKKLAERAARISARAA